jgi:phosphoglycerate-specific signal transduction histidine kinase
LIAYFSLRISPSSHYSFKVDYREAQAELAHVTRVTTRAELTAAITHEVNQPLQASAPVQKPVCGRLDRGTSNLDAARCSVERIINDCNRAGEVIERVRALAKRTKIQSESLHINDIVDEFISLVSRGRNSRPVSGTLLCREGIMVSNPPVNSVVDDRACVRVGTENLLNSSVTPCIHLHWPRSAYGWCTSATHRA